MTIGYEERVRALPCWQSPAVDLIPLTGGLSNTAFIVRDGAERFVARLGEDIPAHHVFRAHEAEVSRAAFSCGLSPELVHAGQGVTVVRFIDGRTFSEADMRDHVEPIAGLLRRCHREMARAVTGPGRMFWVFHILRDYAATLAAGNSRFLPLLPPYLASVERLEALQPPLPVVFGHHDLLPGNFLHDGKRLWLIDWEYGAFGTALFDLANVATNAGLSPEAEVHLLDAYFGHRPDDAILRGFDAMKVASTLREAMWAMVSDIHLTASGIDYSVHAADYLARTDSALDAFRERHGPW